MRAVSIYRSPLGPLTLTASDGALTGLSFGEREEPAGESPAILRAEAWLDGYFLGRDPGPLTDIRLTGTPFQRAVWQLLAAIPYGTTVTYGQLARELEHSSGRRVSAQAVGGAVGRNPIAIIVPCHRVIGADGALTGYAYGLDIKRELLRLEGSYRQK